METVDDKGPKHEFLSLLRRDVIRRPGLFQETAKVGAYVLTHNAVINLITTSIIWPEEHSLCH